VDKSFDSAATCLERKFDRVLNLKLQQEVLIPQFRWDVRPLARAWEGWKKNHPNVPLESEVREAKTKLQLHRFAVVRVDKYPADLVAL
jgi:hypothetical protein